jgi:hypothetical protein
MYYYCNNCGIIDEDDVYRKLIHEAVYYPNDMAHPAEYDEPACPSCGNYVSEYVCDDCLTKGDCDEETLYVDERLAITCHKCFTKKQAEKWLSNFHVNTVLNLTSKFGFIDEKETHEYAWELIKEILKEKQS